MIEENLIHAVIGLPTNLFYGAGISAALLILKKDRKQSDVLFIDGSRDFQEGKKQNKLRDEDIEKILETYRKRKSKDKYSRVVAKKDVEKSECSLNISLYVDSAIEEEVVDIKAVQKEIENIEASLVEVRTKMKKYLKELNI